MFYNAIYSITYITIVIFIICNLPIYYVYLYCLYPSSHLSGMGFTLFSLQMYPACQEDMQVNKYLFNTELDKLTPSDRSTPGTLDIFQGWWCQEQYHCRLYLFRRQIILHCMDRPCFIYAAFSCQTLNSFRVFLAILNNAAQNICIQIFVGLCSFPLDIYLRLDFEGSYDKSIFNF